MALPRSLQSIFVRGELVIIDCDSFCGSSTCKTIFKVDKYHTEYNIMTHKLSTGCKVEAQVVNNDDNGSSSSGDTCRQVN